MALISELERELTSIEQYVNRIERESVPGSVTAVAAEEIKKTTVRVRAANLL
jgi:hypothetical protein